MLQSLLVRIKGASKNDKDQIHTIGTQKQQLKEI
jgi:hypothetical protein